MVLYEGLTIIVTERELRNTHEVHEEERLQEQVLQTCKGNWV